MATFEAQTMVDPNPGVNALYNAQQGQWIQNQRNQLAAQASQQDLTDRATLRGLAPGLAANDPTAYAGAAVLPAGANTVSAMTGVGELGLKQQELAFKLAQIRGANSALDSVYPGNTGAATTPGQGGPSGTFEHQLGAYEAPGGPGSENKGGYIGQFQFGASRLADLGMYAPAPGEDVSKNQWGGTFDIPGFPDVKTKADFLASPAAQHAAFQSHVGSIDTAIAQTPGADKLDPNGLRAVAHLGGVDGMRKFVASGGTYDPADSNGTHLSDYYQRFAAAGAPGLQAVFGSPHGPGGPPAQQTATAAPVTPGGVAARTGGTNVAGPGAGPVAPPGSTAAPGAAPLLVPGSGGPGPRVAPTAQNTLAPPAPAQPVVAPPPAPVAQPAPVQATPQPSAGRVPPTAPPAIDAQNLTAADHDALNAMKQGFKLTMNPQGAQLLQAEIEKRQATNIARAHQYWEDQRTVANTPNFQWDDKQGAYVDTTGTHPPVTPPSPRMTLQPGVGLVQAKPGGGAVVVSPMNPAGITEQKAAETSGAAAGEQAYKAQSAAYQADIPEAKALTVAAQGAQASMPRLNEMATLASQLATGPTAELRAKGAAMLQAAGASPDTIKTWTGMPSGAAAQEFIKLSIATAGGAAKADVGANNGIQSLTLYQNANPGMALLPDANIRITNMMRVAAQQIQDYGQGALKHFGANEDSYLAGHEYHPLTAFNREWQAQANPQIGAAAMGILNGDPFEKWSAKITPAQATQATALAARVDPKVMVPTRSGVPQPASVILAHPTITGGGG